jgi:hypothetical protein
MDAPDDLPIRLPIDLPGGASGDVRYPVERWNPPHCGHSAMRIDRDGRWWHALLDDWVAAGPDHAITLDMTDNGPRPYLGLSNGLRARIDRPAYYALAELALADESDPPGVWSHGVFFPLVGAA